MKWISNEMDEYTMWQADMSETAPQNRTANLVPMGFSIQAFYMIKLATLLIQKTNRNSI